MPKKNKTANLGLSSQGAVRLARQSRSAGVKPFEYATLVYPFAFTSSSVTGNVWYWQWRLNSLFDPDFTGGGQQPTTFDQWMALYDRYRVLACDVDIEVTDSTLLIPQIGCAGPSVDAVPTLTFQGVMGLRDAMLAKRPYPCTNRVKRTFVMKDIFGVDEEAMMSELNFTGTSGSSAASVAYLSFALQSASSTGTVLCGGTLRFAVRFEAPHANNVSLARPVPPKLDPPLLSQAEQCEYDRLRRIKELIEGSRAGEPFCPHRAGVVPHP